MGVSLICNHESNLICFKASKYASSLRTTSRKTSSQTTDNSASSNRSYNPLPPNAYSLSIMNLISWRHPTLWHLCYLEWSFHEGYIASHLLLILEYLIITWQCAPCILEASSIIVINLGDYNPSSEVWALVHYHFNQGVALHPPQYHIYQMYL